MKEGYPVTYFFFKHDKIKCVMPTAPGCHLHLCIKKHMQVNKKPTSHYKTQSPTEPLYQRIVGNGKRNITSSRVLLFRNSNFHWGITLFKIAFRELYLSNTLLKIHFYGNAWKEP